MKTQLLLLLLGILLFSRSYSQMDPQWLVLDSKGKSAYNETTLTSTYSNSLTSRMKLEGVAHVPLAPTASYPRNDVFIIYTDGTYYNSRDYTCGNYSSTFFTPTATNAGDLEHYFNAGSKSIQAMYLSNIYEGDDPPRRTRATSYTITPPVVYNLPNTNSGLNLSSNHTVVMGKDITLVQKSSGVSKDDTLYANQLLQLNNMSLVKGTFFSGSRVFSSNTAFSNVPLDDRGNGKFVFGEIPAGTTNIFINLKGTSALAPHIGLADAMFTIKKPNGTTVSVLQEKLSSAHDPNYIELLSTCEKGTGDDVEKFAYYHMEFENTGDLPADDIRFVVKFPSYLRKSCISDVKFVIGGVEVAGEVHRHLNGNVHFQYPEESSVLPCVSGTSPECSGYVEFCIKVKKMINLTSLATTFEFEEAEARFGNQPYPINYFEDMNLVFAPDGTSQRAGPTSDCTCTCD